MGIAASLEKCYCGVAAVPLEGVLDQNGQDDHLVKMTLPSSPKRWHTHKIVAGHNFRICNAIGLPTKICASLTFEYVMQPNFLGSQVVGRAIFLGNEFWQYVR